MGEQVRPQFSRLLVTGKFAGGSSEPTEELQPRPKTRRETMTLTMLSTITRAIMATAIAVAVSHATVAAQHQAPERSLAGVWVVQITPRNCATGVPIPTASFEALFTFHEDKTMSVSLRNNTLTLERTAAHGLWRRDLGWSDYSFKFVHIRRTVSTGTFAGLQESAGSVVLAGSGDEFTTDASTTGFDVNGNPVGAPSCSNSVGTRYKFEP